jgi:hypothetical protein
MHSTPWLTTRRRTCPICKGDVVRSLAHGPSTGPRYEPFRDDSDDDIQAQAAGTINDSATAGRPIARSLDDENDEDLEEGIASPAPARPSVWRTGSWMSSLASSFASSSRSPGPQEDRSR